MNTFEPCWGSESRFFLPNEDALMVNEAVSMLDKPPRSPVFVGGSGLLMTEVVRTLPENTRARYVDISLFQVEHFKQFLWALDRSETPDQLRDWFAKDIYPGLRDHFLKFQDRLYTRDQVFGAMKKLFGIKFFFEPDAFRSARRVPGSVEIFNEDIQSYLNRTERQFDFVYLSNVLDYMPTEKLAPLFRSCMVSTAPVYVLLTEACKEPERVTAAWEESGYSPHPGSIQLTARNRGLGSRNLKRTWNRTGDIKLLMPFPGESG